MYTLTEDLTLKQALSLFFPESSHRTHQQWMRAGRIYVDEVVCEKGDSMLKKGQILSLGNKQPHTRVSGIRIIYQDRWLIVIDKPVGLLSVPAEKEEINALHLLKFGFKSTSLLPVHRLDQQSSGVLVFARCTLAREKLSALFEKHDLTRQYIAVVEGHIFPKEGTWEHYLIEKSDYSVEVTTPELGRKAISHYQVLKYSKKLTALQVTLETGRKHQIRVQAAHTGHCVVGDKRYGSLMNPFKRMCLHAHTLSFVHPFLQKKMTFSAPMAFL